MMRAVLFLLLATSWTFAEDTGLLDALDAYLATVDEVIVEAEREDPSVPVEKLTGGGSHNVVGPKMIRDATPKSVEDIVRRLPGVSVRLYSGDEHARPSISVRGMPDNGFTEYTAVHVDGLNYSTLFYGWTALSIFPVTSERIHAAEVFRGAHAIRFGPNTIGGVINLVTRPIPDRPTFMASTIFGSFNYLSGHVLMGNTWDSGWGALFEYVQKSGDTFRDDNEFNVNEGALKLKKAFSKASYLQLNVFHWRDTHQLPARLTRAQLDADPSQNPTERRIDWNGWAYGGDLTYHHQFGANSYLDLRGYFRKARRALDSGRPRTGPPFDSVRNADSDNYNAGLELRGQQELGTAHTIYYGVRYHYEQIDRMTFQVFDDNSPTDLQSDSKTWTHAISANVDDTWTWKRLTVVFGLRLEWIPEMRGEDAVSGNSQDFDFLDVFPGLSINFTTSEKTALFVNVHRSFRAPQTWAFDFSGSPQDFEFERGTNAELGWRWQNFHGDSGSIVLWTVDFSNFIDFDDITENFRNLGGFRSYGVDFILRHDFAPQGARGLSIYSNLTLQGSEFTTGMFDGNNTPFVPAAVLSAGIRYEHLQTGLYGVFEGYYRSDSWIDAENTTKTPSYWLFDVRIGWRKQIAAGTVRITIDVAVGAKNLFDEDYYLQHNAALFVPGTPRALFGQMVLRCEF